MRVISGSSSKGQTKDKMNWNEMEGAPVKGQWTPNLASHWSHLKCWVKCPFPGTTLIPPQEFELALGLGMTGPVLSGGSWLMAFQGRHFSCRFFWVVNPIFYRSLITYVKPGIFAASTILRSLWVLRLWILTSPAPTNHSKDSERHPQIIMWLWLFFHFLEII